MRALIAILSAIAGQPARAPAPAPAPPTNLAPATAPELRPVSVERQPDRVRLRTGQLALMADLSTGKTSLKWDGGATISGETVAARLADGEDLSAADYPQHQCDADDIEPIDDGFGVGVKLTVHHRKPGAPELRQRWWVYGGRAEVFTELEVVAGEDPSDSGTSDKTARGTTRPAAEQIASNRLLPVTVGDGIDLDQGDILQTLEVPWDNDGFARFRAHPGSAAAPRAVRSHEVTAIYDNVSRRGLVIGSVSHEQWKTGLTIAASAGRRVDSLAVVAGMADSSTRDTQPHGMVRGNTLRSPRVMLGWFTDWRDGMEAFGRANAIIQPALPWRGGVPFGWNSWAAYKSKLSAAGVEAATDFLVNDLIPAGFTSGADGGADYLNLDSFWDFLKPEDRAASVTRAHKAGLKAGIYWTPFASWADKLETKVEGTHGQWTYGDIVLKDDSGKPLAKLDGAWALDPTHPGTRARNAFRYRQFVDWGYDFIKLDFMSHGALEGRHFDPSVQTGAQAYTVGLSDVRSAFDPATIGRPFFISLSIAPLFPHGFAHTRRVSCDAFSDIGASEYLLNSINYGWWMHGTLYAFNDPDHSVIYRTQGEAPVSEAEGRSRLTASVVGGGMLLLSDDFSDPAARTRAKALLTNRQVIDLARQARAFRPAEGDTGSKGGDTFVLRAGDDWFVAVFNFDKSKPVTRTLSRMRLGIGPGRFVLHDLWTGQERVLEADADMLRIELAQADCALIRLSR